jgi:hypothetical protein
VDINRRTSFILESTQTPIGFVKVEKLT